MSLPSIIRPPHTRLFAVLLLAALLVGSQPVLADAPPTTVNCKAQHFLFTDNMVLASVGEALFRFTATGWQPVPVPGAWDQVRLGPNGVVYLYDAVSDSLYSSADGGQTWSPPQYTPFSTLVFETFFPSPIPNMFFMGVSSWSSGEGGVWKSSDGGMSWERVLMSNGAFGEVEPIAFSPAFASDATAFAIETGKDTFVGVQKSADFGESWAPATNGMQTPALGGYDRWLAISPAFATDGTVFSSGGPNDAGFYRSVNAGTNWEYLSGISPAFAAVSPHYAQDGRVLFANRADGVYLSEAQGDARLLVGDLPGATIVGLRSPGGAEEPQEFWAVVQPTYGSACQLYRSADDGASWEGQVLFTPSPRIYLPLVVTQQ